MSSSYMPAQSVCSLHLLAVDVSQALLGLELHRVLEGFLRLPCEKMLRSYISSFSLGRAQLNDHHKDLVYLILRYTRGF